MKRIDLLCGFLDALIVFMIGALLKLDGRLDVISLFTHDARFFLPYAVPGCALVGWRGTRHSTRLLAGELDWGRPILEGFGWGFLAGFLMFTEVIVREAWAAGPLFDRPESLESWVRLLTFMIGMSSLCGVVGAFVAGALSGVNRVIVKWAS